MRELMKGIVDKTVRVCSYAFVRVHMCASVCACACMHLSVLVTILATCLASSSEASKRIHAAASLHLGIADSAGGLLAVCLIGAHAPRRLLKLLFMQGSHPHQSRPLLPTPATPCTPQDQVHPSWRPTTAIPPHPTPQPLMSTGRAHGCPSPPAGPGPPERVPECRPHGRPLRHPRAPQPGHVHQRERL